MIQAVVEPEDVCFCRGEQRILSDMSWKIEPGQHWALLECSYTVFRQGNEFFLRVDT